MTGDAARPGLARAPADHPGGTQSRAGPWGTTLAFLVVAAAALWLVHIDRRPEPIFADQFTHDDAAAVFVTAKLPLELTLRPGQRPSVLRMPVWVGSGRRPVEIRVAVGGPGQTDLPVAVTRVPETALARIEVPQGGPADALLRVLVASDATTRETAPRVLWSRDPPRWPLEIRYAGRPLAEVAVLPQTGPLIFAEYPWPTRWLLGLWLVPLAVAVPAWRRGGRWIAFAFVALALAATVSSALLWQRDYTRRLPHLDADRYAESAEQLARFVLDPDARPAIVAWFRDHPHSTTELVPAVLAPFVLIGVPATYAYTLLSALASWLALCVVQRVAARGLDVSDATAWLVAAAMACHPLMLRTFARPVTDAVGLLLVVCTLGVLLRRMRTPGRCDELLLALLVLAHPLARPQGFGYWPFIAVAMLFVDRVREGEWPPLPTLFVRGLRVFAPPLLVLGALYVQLDWWHNVGLMMEKARRFRLASTAGDFAASCMGVVQALPLLALLRPRHPGRPFWRDPRTRLLTAWVFFSAMLLVAVRAPFWLRHFVPTLPAIYWLAAMWIVRLEGRVRNVGLGLLTTGSVIGVVVTLWQVVHLEPLPGWIAPFVAMP